MQKIVSVVILLILTPCCLLIATGDIKELSGWYYHIFDGDLLSLRRSWSYFLFMSEFNELPWIRMSIIITAFTVISAHLINRDYEILESSFLYGFLVTPILFFVSYQGLNPLSGHFLPGSGSGLILLGILHGVTFFYIGSLRIEEDELRCERIRQEVLSELNTLAQSGQDQQQEQTGDRISNRLPTPNDTTW